MPRLDVETRQKLLIKVSDIDVSDARTSNIGHHWADTIPEII